MDLIAIDENRKERFVLTNLNADFAVGDENTFNISLPIIFFEKMKNIKFLSFEKTEFGGQIDSYKIDTTSDIVNYSGRCWRKIIDEKIIVPPEGQDYLVVSGKITTIMQQALVDAGLSDMFEVQNFSNKTISNFKFNRYCTLLEGFSAIVSQIDCVIKFQYQNGKVLISAEKLKVIEMFDNYDCRFEIEKSKSQINHLICLGSGELANRQVLNLFLDENKNIVEKQFYFGEDERTQIYDYPNAEDIESLKSSAIERFKALLKDENIGMTLNDVDLEIGQYVVAIEHLTNTNVKKRISKKILTQTNKQSIIKYEVDD